MSDYQPGTYDYNQDMANQIQKNVPRHAQQDPYGYNPYAQQDPYANNPYGYGGAQPASHFSRAVSFANLKDDRSFILTVVLTFITAGIFYLYRMMEMGECLNTVASKYDGKRSMNFILVAIISVFTMGIPLYVWSHRFTGRLGDELRRRGKYSDLSPATFWLWDVLGSLIIVGPFVYLYKVMEGMNELCADYNVRG